MFARLKRGLRFYLLGLAFFLLIIILVVNSARLKHWTNRLFNRQPAPAPVVYKAEKTLRITEGSRNSDIAQILSANGLATPAQFAAAQRDYDTAKFSFLKSKPAKLDLEGYLYPDTYRVFASSTPEEIITKMLSNFDKKLTPQMREDIAASGHTINQIVTMASIIEKEAPISYQTGDNRDARIISGIFWRRLKNDQPLQSCATLAYVLGVDKKQYSGTDTQVNSPYNTYVNRGLPPGPISNPGILAIEAAIYPLASDYNYFLTPSGSQKIVYAATYEEHLRNKEKYLEK